MTSRSPSRLTLLAEDPALALSSEAFFARSGSTQRGRLLEAVTHVVAERGYGGATVSDIVAVAGVSRTTFYELFNGKKECLLDSYRVGSRIMLDRITAAASEAAQGGWREATAAGVTVYLETIRAEPEIARAHFVELPAVGPEAIDARREVHEQFAGRITELASVTRPFDPTTPSVDSALVKLLLAGVQDLVAQTLHSSRREDLIAVKDLAITGFDALFRPL